MRVEGIHHITAITGDAPRNVDFYARLLGLRLVKKTVNHDSPDVYHLYYGDEAASPGTILTFFEFPGAAPGHAGAGMIHSVAWRVGSDDALGFWANRLAGDGVDVEHAERRLRFRDPEGLPLEITVAGDEAPRVADAPDVPAEHALSGFVGVRAYAADAAASTPLLGDALGFAGNDREWTIEGDERSTSFGFDDPPPDRPVQGAGTVHHIAFAVHPDDQLPFRERALAAGAHATPVIDRTYFRSVYFREPNGVLLELATIGPGFAIDEDPAHLGERLTLPERYEPMRARLEQSLTPIANPRTGARPTGS